MRRVWNMLRTTANRDANRLMLTLAPFLFLLTIMLLGWIVMSGAGFNLRTGALFFRIQFFLSLPLLGFISIRAASDVVRISHGNWRDLLKLCGVPAWQWVVMRWLQCMTCVLIVWVMRMPMLSLFFTLGGVNIESMIVSELLLLCFSIAAICFGLFATYTAQTRGQVWGCVALFIIAQEALLFIPQRLFNHPRVSPVIATPLVEFADLISSLRLGPKLISVLVGGITWQIAWPALLTYLLVATATLLVFIVIFYRSSDDAPHINETKLTEPATAQTSMLDERCWDDALAWQACVYHLGGQSARKVKWIALGAMSAGLGALSFYGLTREMWGIFAAAGPVALLNGVGQVGTCLEKEVKEQTMSTLMLTPHNELDFYHGWQRGAWKSMTVEWVACVLSLLITAWFNFEMVFVVLAGIICVAVSMPFFTLATLVPLTPKGIPTSILVVFFLVLFIILSFIIGAMSAPIFGSFFAVLTIWAYNAVIYYKLLSPWLIHKMSRTHEEF